jgi:hypothetical protein
VLSSVLFLADIKKLQLNFDLVFLNSLCMFDMRAVLQKFMHVQLHGKSVVEM